MTGGGSWNGCSCLQSVLDPAHALALALDPVRVLVLSLVSAVTGLRTLDSHCTVRAVVLADLLEVVAARSIVVVVVAAAVAE